MREVNKLKIVVMMAILVCILIRGEGKEVDCLIGSSPYATEEKAAELAREGLRSRDTLKLESFGQAQQTEEGLWVGSLMRYAEDERWATELERVKARGGMVVAFMFDRFPGPFDEMMLRGSLAELRVLDAEKDLLLFVTAEPGSPPYYSDGFLATVAIREVSRLSDSFFLKRTESQVRSAHSAGRKFLAEFIPIMQQVGVEMGGMVCASNSFHCTMVQDGFWASNMLVPVITIASFAPAVNHGLPTIFEELLLQDEDANIALHTIFYSALTVYPSHWLKETQDQRIQHRIAVIPEAHIWHPSFEELPQQPPSSFHYHDVHLSADVHEVVLFITPHWNAEVGLLDDFLTVAAELLSRRPQVHIVAHRPTSIASTRYPESNRHRMPALSHYINRHQNKQTLLQHRDRMHIFEHHDMPREEYVRLLHLSSVLLLLHGYDLQEYPLPRSVKDAMAARALVIGLPSDRIRSGVTDGVTGVLVPQQQMADATVDALEHPDRYSAILDAARNDVRQHSTPAMAAKRYRELLDIFFRQGRHVKPLTEVDNYRYVGEAPLTSEHDDNIAFDFEKRND